MEKSAAEKKPYKGLLAEKCQEGEETGSTKYKLWPSNIPSTQGGKMLK